MEGKNNNSGPENNPLQGKTILFLNTGSSSSTGSEDFKLILKRIGELEINVIAVSKEVNNRQKCIKHWILSELFEHDKTIRAIEEFISNHPEIKIDGAVTYHEDTVLLTAKVTERLKLAGVPFKVADLVRNKLKFRDFCAKHKLPTPKYFKINSRTDLRRVQDKLKFPIVLKPIYGAASAFVIKVDDYASLPNTYDYIKKNISKKIDSSLGSLSTILAEEYIDGDEVDMNILIQNSRIKFYNITDNHQTKEPFFIETGMTEPSALLDSQKKELIDMADEVLETLNIQNGCLQFEAKWTKKGPMPLEINMRMGGDEAYSFARDAWGVDLIEGTMRIATRVPMKKVDKSKYPKKYFAGDTINAPYSGVVSKIEIDNDLKNCDYLENLVLYKKVGDSVLAPPFGYEYMGWLAVSGPNPVDAGEKLKQVLKKIKYSVVKFDESSSMGKTIRQDNNKNAVFSVNKKFIGKERIEKIRSIPLAQQRKLHIGIVGNDNSLEKDNGNTANEQIKIGKNIAKTLAEVGYKVSIFDFNLTQKTINDLNKSRVDLVFNVCERINGTSLLKPHAASAFDILQIPYTGSNPITLALCQDKIKFKKLLNFHNIPTSAWDCVYSLDDEVDPNLKFPLIVKPSNTDNSIGISNHSIVTNRKELDKRVRYILKNLVSPVLIEEYIDGDEYDAFIMGNDEKNFKVLPLCRTIFSNLPEEYWHIKTIKTKLGRDKTYQEKIITQIPPLKTNSKLMRLITEIAIDTYNILDCHDYGLVEIKTDKNNNPYILEMNTNPRLGVNNIGPQTAKLSGMKYSDLLEDIIRLAIERYKKNPPYHHLQTKAS